MCKLLIGLKEILKSVLHVIRFGLKNLHGKNQADANDNKANIGMWNNSDQNPIREEKEMPEKTNDIGTIPQENAMIESINKLRREGKDYNETKKVFRIEFLKLVEGIDMKGIPPKVALAVSETETGAGTGNVFQQTNNLFSITAGKNWGGLTYKAGTGYVFRKYKYLADSVYDWVRLMNVSLYKLALDKLKANDIPGFFQALQSIGYAGPDNHYALKLQTAYNHIVKSENVG